MTLEPIGLIMSSVLFKTWSDFLSYEGSHQDRMQLLHQSALCFSGPQKQRPVYFPTSVWVGLVDPKFAFEALQCLRQMKEQGTSEVNEGDLAAIREDAGRTYVGSLSVLNAPNREK